MQADLNAAEQDARKTKPLQPVFVSQPRAVRWGQKYLKHPGCARFSGGCNAGDSGSTLQEATVSERRLLTCAAYRGSTGTTRTCQRTNSKSDSRYASRPGR